MSSEKTLDILFLDIETVPQYPSWDLVPEEWRELWNLKANNLIKNKTEETPESIYSRAGIYAEFGKIVCISFGTVKVNLNEKQEEKTLILRSCYGENEKELLTRFAKVLGAWGTKRLCAHNGKEFDFPYLSRRMVINEIPIPPSLSTWGKKPWEVNHLDTMEMWKFGDFKSYTSLNLLAHTLGIPSPKEDMNGSMVAEVYWKQKDLNRIAIYCEKDVITLANVYFKMIGESPVNKTTSLIDIKPDADAKPIIDLKIDKPKRQENEPDQLSIWG